MTPAASASTSAWLSAAGNVVSSSRSPLYGPVPSIPVQALIPTRSGASLWSIVGSGVVSDAAGVPST